MEPNKPKFFDNRYSSRNKLQAGQYRGVGLPGKVGSKQNDVSRLNTEVRVERVPPLKFN